MLCYVLCFVFFFFGEGGGGGGGGEICEIKYILLMPVMFTGKSLQYILSDFYANKSLISRLLLCY